MKRPRAGPRRGGHCRWVFKEIGAEGAALESRLSCEEGMLRMDRAIPFGRSNTPEDIAEMAVFRASDRARNITGQSANVDGGLTVD